VSDGGDLELKRCAKCAALIPASATMCAYCNTSSPDEPLKRSRGSVLSIRHGMSVTHMLIVANLLYFVFSISVARARGVPGNPVQWALTGTGLGPGIWLAGGNLESSVEAGQWWRLVCATFLHFGLIHLAMNMFALRNLGELAEELFGTAKFLTVYLVSGLGCTVAMAVWDRWIHPGDAPGLGAGASGAICGVLGLLIVFLFRAGPGAARNLARSLAMNGILILIIGFGLPAGSTVGHVGGFVVGAACGLVMTDRFAMRFSPASRRLWTRIAGLCVAVTVAALLCGAWFAVTHKGGMQ